MALTPSTLRLDGKGRNIKFLDEKLHAKVKTEAKRKFKVYPSAYANAWMVQEYKRRGGKFRTDSLDKWFNEKWVRMSSTGKILGPCGDRTKSEGKPKCLPAAKAQALSPAERRTLVARKRRNDPKKERSGAPIMVSSKTDIWGTGFDAEDGKKYVKTVTDPETGRKKKVRYGAKGYRISPGTPKGDRYCARSFGDMKSEGFDCSGKEKNTPLCLSRAKWKCSGKTSRRDAEGKPCGNSTIPKAHKCSKGGGGSKKAAVAAGLTAALVGGALLHKGSRRAILGAPAAGKRMVQSGITEAVHRATAKPPSMKLTAKAFQQMKPPSKTERLRAAAASANQEAEAAIKRASESELRRLREVGEAMYLSGKATRASLRSGTRSHRLTVEKLRRRYEPGYRRGRSDMQFYGPTYL